MGALGFLILVFSRQIHPRFAGEQEVTAHDAIDAQPGFVGVIENLRLEELRIRLIAADAEHQTV